MTSTSFRVAADAIVMLHVAFVAFVVFGGVLLIRWRWLLWLHMPAVVWGVTIEFAGWICPLTPLENYLRQRGGAVQYQGEFIEHYIMPLLYPARLTRGIQALLGSLALALNVFVYWIALKRWRALTTSNDGAR